MSGLYWQTLHSWFLLLQPFLSASTEYPCFTRHKIRLPWAGIDECCSPSICAVFSPFHAHPCLIISDVDAVFSKAPSPNHISIQLQSVLWATRHNLSCNVSCFFRSFVKHVILALGFARPLRAL
jgi:hypothetical protein